jgi:hypothetical protein
MASIISKAETDFRNAPVNQAANTKLKNPDGLFYGATQFSGALTNQTGPNKGKLNGQLAEAMFKPYTVNTGLNTISIDSDSDSGLSPIQVLLSGNSKIKQALTPAGALPVMAVAENRDYMRLFYGLSSNEKDSIPVAFQLKTTTDTVVQASKNNEGETLTQYQLMQGDTPGTFVRQLFSKDGQHIFRVKYDKQHQPEAFQLVNNTSGGDKQSAWLALTDLDNGSVAKALATFTKATGDDVASLKKIFELEPTPANPPKTKAKPTEKLPATPAGKTTTAPKPTPSPTTSTLPPDPTTEGEAPADEADSVSDQAVQDYMDANPVGTDTDFETAKAQLKAHLKLKADGGDNNP